MINAAIVGGSGYTGGELARLLLFHPEIELMQVTSRQLAGHYLYQVHPNLRNITRLKFIPPESLIQSDIIFLAMPHGEAQEQIDYLAKLAPKLIDLSADFRLRNPKTYQEWYEHTHAAPEWLGKFTYGLPELHRDQLKIADYISGVGCNATAVNLALLPLVQADLIDTNRTIIAEVKVGSSESGATVNAGSHHPERSNIARTYAPYGHRHTAEILQENNLKDFTLTLTSVDMVRGALATVHAFIKEETSSQELWKAYRQTAQANPFLRIVKEKRGIYRVPEPKILAGSNYADLGFDFDEKTGRVVSICAIDNLMKGAAGSAVQSMNLAFGFDETSGLEFPGLHPI
jgi:N-acetyl-gamma-glutamyl-phosphate/LysW-gamma-L-alpha-aminoadipyl-6-phosphate reductase